MFTIARRRRLARALSRRYCNNACLCPSSALIEFAKPAGMHSEMARWPPNEVPRQFGDPAYPMRATFVY